MRYVEKGESVVKHTVNEGFVKVKSTKMVPRNVNAKYL